MRWVVLLLLFGVVTPADANHEVAGSSIFDTGPFPCDGTAHEQVWTNPGPWTIYIYKARVFHGRDYGVIADYHSEVRKHDWQGSLVALFQQDAYDQSPLRWLDTSYEGHVQSVPPGDSLLLRTWCKQFGGTGVSGHTVVTIWWAGQPA